MVDIMSVLSAVGFPLLRSITGWAGNALADSKVTVLEWRLLVETLIRVGMIELAIFYGVTIAGLDISMWAAGAAAFLADKLFSAMKQSIAVKKK